MGQNWEEKQPLEVGSRVEMPQGTSAAGKLARYIGEKEGYTHVYVIDDKATYVLPAELAQKLRRPFDVGDTVMCMIGDTTVGATIVERDAYGSLTVKRADNGWKLRVAESQLKRLDNSWWLGTEPITAHETVMVGEIKAKVLYEMGGMYWLKTEDKRMIAVNAASIRRLSPAEKLKARFPVPPEGMFWDLTANVDGEEPGAVTFEVSLNVETHTGEGAYTKYSSVVWSEGMSEDEVFEAVLREAQELTQFFPKDTQKFRHAQQISMEFGRKTRD